MAKVEVKQVQKRFGTATIIPSLDLTITSGEFMVLVGPSGCGKSTLLRMIAGLEDTTAGELAIDGRVVNDLSPKDRGVAMVFQNYALYPHMTVKENLAFGLKLAKHPAEEIEKRVTEAAKVLAITEHLAKKPSQLSGGQKQRVAMGRAMVRHPKVFLFDEPLSNLDAQLRVKMRSEISMLHRRLQSTIVYVTHDQVEAMTLADRIAVMYQGRLEQLGTPLEVYHDPKTRFVASFIGTPPMNFLPAALFPAGIVPAGATEVGFRPEATELSPVGETSPRQGGGAGGRVALGVGRVSLVEPLGTTAYVHVTVGDHTFVAERKANEAPHLDSEVAAFASPSALFFFDGAGQRVRVGA